MLKQLSFLFGVLSFCYGAKFNCVETNKNECKISGINLTEPERIEPVAVKPSDITHLILEGNLSILTGGFCEYFPNLRNFQANSVSLKVIKDFAFQGCHKLEEIIMTYNELKNIEKNSFTGLKKLKILELADGNIPIFDVDLSDLIELKSLSLINLNITDFPTDILREQKNLEDLHIYLNNLFDLEVEGILKYTPNLKAINLDLNNFKCNRLTDIVNLLKEKNIRVIGEESETIKGRDYTPDDIDRIRCISDELWIKLNPNLN